MKSTLILYLGNKLTVHGFTPTSVETLGPALSKMGYRLESRSAVKNSFFRLLDMLYSIWDLRKHRPVVLIDTYSTTAFWYAYASALVCAALGLRYIPILRGGDLPSRLDRSPRVSKTLFGNSFANVAVSGYLDHEFAGRNIPTQIIHNHIYISDYPFQSRRVLRPMILWVRAFHEIYNPALAIDILKKLTHHFPEAKLCMVGPDKDGSLEKCRNLASGLNVEFTGKLSKKDWIILSEQYDIFLNTTNVDNTPISVMEAMALGLPVVSTNAGGVPFIINNDADGLLVNKNNADEAVAAMLRLLSDPAKAESLSQAARKRAEEWDWSCSGAKWKQLIDSVNGMPS